MPVAIATAAWNLPRLAIGYAHNGGILIRRFYDRSHGMTWKGGATPHLLRTLCTIRSQKITTAVTVAPKHTGDLKLLPPKLHNKLKSPIDRTILVLGRINAPPHNRRAAEIGVGIAQTRQSIKTKN